MKMDVCRPSINDLKALGNARGKTGFDIGVPSFYNSRLSLGR